MSDLELERLRGKNAVLVSDVATLRQRITDLQELLANQVIAALRGQVLTADELIKLLEQARQWERTSAQRDAAEQLVRTDATEARLRGDR